MLSFLPSLPGAKAKPRADAAKSALRPENPAHADVRLKLASRLVALFPGLSKEQYAGLYACAVQILGNIALEEVLKIRKALQGTLKDFACLPPKIAEELARETEKLISEPVLRFCAGLSDKDLRSLLAHHPNAKPAGLAANFRPGQEMAALPAPGENQLSTSWLSVIVNQARQADAVRGYTAPPKYLPSSIVRRLETYVDKTIEELLIEREDLDYQSIYEVTGVFRRRVDYMAARREWGTEIDYLRQLVKTDMLDERVIADALAVQDYPFVWAALAYKAKTTMQNVQKVFGMKAARPIVALCWQAGISMRFAFQLQKDAGFVPAADLIYPKEGSDYPLSPETLDWQLEFLGLKVA